MNKLKWIAILLSLSPLASANNTCQPLGWSHTQMQQQYQDGFKEIGQTETLRFLETVLPCLRALDPFLRDQIGYEATSHLLRQPASLDQAFVTKLRWFKDQLLKMLKAPDPEGVTHPFVIIVLAEVARTDRIHNWMTANERAALTTTAEGYVSSVEDYRAFEDEVGFRHGVAHGADLMLQLILNQQVEAQSLIPFTAAITGQISPSDGTSYITGEPGRLARVIFYLMQRAGKSPELQTAIIDSLKLLGTPDGYSDWSEVFKSETGLAFRHNRRAFVEALYVHVMPHAEHELIHPYVEPMKELVKVIP